MSLVAAAVETTLYYRVLFYSRLLPLLCYVVAELVRLSEISTIPLISVHTPNDSINSIE